MQTGKLRQRQRAQVPSASRGAKSELACLTADYRFADPSSPGVGPSGALATGRRVSGKRSLPMWGVARKRTKLSSEAGAEPGLAWKGSASGSKLLPGTHRGLDICSCDGPSPPARSLFPAPLGAAAKVNREACSAPAATAERSPQETQTQAQTQGRSQCDQVGGGQAYGCWAPMTPYVGPSQAEYLLMQVTTWCRVGAGRGWGSMGPNWKSHSGLWPCTMITQQTETRTKLPSLST